ncbi:conserved hypothetical protein [Chloroherpeton thalassium ATCC 35110]|uniref:DUF2905 domain-containing protein n=1 Tax=Chloroherpeton thalassium (strain ATCC 35110 / GB-78) TaxID=517418 RepID=B3QTX1_CHLT3|nr:DUF2905 domain-containing protein [Chloroherpeton thalassium]ACF14319.1 conserved hypothetical protein [Chloroherpeton thalassium ATCC 35110]
MIDFSKTLILVGLAIAAVGMVLYLAQRVDSSGLGFFSWFGHLPLDFKIEKENFRFYFPLGSSILLSLAVSFVLYILRKISE